MSQKNFPNAVEANVGDVAIATPDEEIVNIGKKFNCNTILTRGDYFTGTDRVFGAYKEINDSNIFSASTGLM